MLVGSSLSSEATCLPAFTHQLSSRLLVVIQGSTDHHLIQELQQRRPPPVGTGFDASKGRESNGFPLVYALNSRLSHVERHSEKALDRQNCRYYPVHRHFKCHIQGTAIHVWHTNAGTGNLVNG